MTVRVGENGRVGFIELSTSVAMSIEAPAAMPAGVLALLSRLRLPGGLATADSLAAMVASAQFEEAALELADAHAAVIAFACTTGSLLHGPGYDLQLIKRLEHATGVTCTTTATAALAALGHLGAKRIGVGTPYIDDLNNRERLFFEAAGLEVLSLKGLNIVNDPEIAQISGEAVRDLALAVRHPDADAVFLSCTNLLTFDVLAELERELGLPVVSSNAATVWYTLALAGQPACAPHFGSLLGGGAGVSEPGKETSNVPNPL